MITASPPAVIIIRWQNSPRPRAPPVPSGTGAALDDGGPCPRRGDAARELDAAERGYAYLGHPDAARLIADVRDRIPAGARHDADRADEVEHQAGQRYAAIIPADATLYSAFRRRLAAEPPAFASAED